MLLPFSNKMFESRKLGFSDPRNATGVCTSSGRRAHSRPHAHTFEAVESQSDSKVQRKQRCPNLRPANLEPSVEHRPSRSEKCPCNSRIKNWTTSFALSCTFIQAHSLKGIKKSRVALQKRQRPVPGSPCTRLKFAWTSNCLRPDRHCGRALGCFKLNWLSDIEVIGVSKGRARSSLSVNAPMVPAITATA